MKYSQVVGIMAALALMGICFFPWVHIPSLHIDLSGWNGKASAELNFGSQIKSHGFFSLVMIVCFLVQAVWAKRTNVFVGAINFSWAIKNFIIFSMCRGGECPEKLPALYALVVVAFIMMIMGFFPKMQVKN
jgi:magnesium-transporting ATPase (P-type)